MGTKVFVRSMHYLLQFTCAWLLLFALIWMSLQSFKSHLSTLTKKTWLRIQINSVPCSLSEECIVFNVTCYSNGNAIFHGIENTAYVGKKRFQLSTNQTIAVHEFIRTHTFTSDFQSIKIIFRIDFSHSYSEIYLWKNDSISYTILALLLDIDRLTVYKRWPTLLRTAYMLSNIQQKQQTERYINLNSESRNQQRQKFKRSTEHQYFFASNRPKRMVIPLTDDSYTTNDYDSIPIDYSELNVRSVRTAEVVKREFDDGTCFSSQIMIAKFDLVDSCLSTNDIIGDNQFYPLRDHFIGSTNHNTPSNGLFRLQGKFGYYFKLGHCFVGTYCLL